MSAAPGDIVLRSLQAADYGKGFLQLLSQLTTVGDISLDAFTDQLAAMDSSNHYCVIVAEDPSTGRLLGTATLLIERKFIHACGNVGHIEDVVVDSAARGLKLGQRLIERLVEAGREAGCYKIILDCAEANVGFYEKCGLSRKEVQMVKYLDR